MSAIRQTVWMCAFVIALIGTGAVPAQEYPNRPIRIIAPPPGGSIDFAGRLIAQGLTAALNQQVIVDNRSSGVTPGQLVTQAAPDGYTLLVAGNSFWTVPLLQKAPYDVIRDFSPVLIVEKSSNIVAVHPSLPVKSIGELISLAKARPDQLNYASGPVGSTNHLSAELFNSMAGVRIVRVNYKGGGPAIAGLVSGEVQVMFGSTVSVVKHYKTGRLRALAVTGNQKSALVPDLPTVSATVPGYEAVASIAMFGPARLPTAVVHRLSQEITRVISRDDVRQKFLAAGSEPYAGPPDELSALMKSDMAGVQRIIRDAGIKVE